MCKAKGIIRASETIDHILPLSDGGLDVDDNCQGLCWPCHDAKTATEAGERFNGGKGSTHPDWLRPAAIPLTIICGPPASGKTTYALTNASNGDAVIDFDAIMASLIPSYRAWHYTGSLDQGLRARNAMLGDLSRATHGRAWFIVSAPTRGERKWWQKQLGGTVVLLDPGQAECNKRSDARGTPRHGVARWYASAGKQWSREGRPTIGPDGWPIEQE
jgi:5-methylcytosine-specific restriction protein A